MERRRQRRRLLQEPGAARRRLTSDDVSVTTGIPPLEELGMRSECRRALPPAAGPDVLSEPLHCRADPVPSLILRTAWPQPWRSAMTSAPRAPTR